MKNNDKIMKQIKKRGLIKLSENTNESVKIEKIQDLDYPKVVANHLERMSQALYQKQIFETDADEMTFVNKMRMMIEFYGILLFPYYDQQCRDDFVQLDKKIVGKQLETYMDHWHLLIKQLRVLQKLAERKGLLLQKVA